jgi:hypothetical protein
MHLYPSDELVYEQFTPCTLIYWWHTALQEQPSRVCLLPSELRAAGCYSSIQPPNSRPDMGSSAFRDAIKPMILEGEDEGGRHPDGKVALMTVHRVRGARVACCGFAGLRQGMVYALTPLQQ